MFLIGISLLRGLLDIPEASLVAILDTDRGVSLLHTLIQMIGSIAPVEAARRSCAMGNGRQAIRGEDNRRRATSKLR